MQLMHDSLKLMGVDFAGLERATGFDYDGRAERPSGVVVEGGTVICQGGCRLGGLAYHTVYTSHRPPPAPSLFLPHHPLHPVITQPRLFIFNPISILLQTLEQRFWLFSDIHCCCCRAS